MSVIVNVEEAKTQLSRLLDQAHAGEGSAWEVATKQRLGKLADVPHAAERFAELVAADGFNELAMTQRHALHAGAYRHEHRDPFDRMPMAQSEFEGLTLVSCDAVPAGFPGLRLW